MTEVRMNHLSQLAKGGQIIEILRTLGILFLFFFVLAGLQDELETLLGSL